MDDKHVGGGVKVTYIETQFVTSDAADFKDLVQRLTGRSGGASGDAPAPAVPHRPRALPRGGAMTAAGAGPQGYYYRPAGEVRSAVVSRAPPCLEELLHEMDDFSDLFYVS